MLSTPYSVGRLHFAGEAIAYPRLGVRNADGTISFKVLSTMVHH